MLRGYIDGIASSGYIEGWALNSEAPLDPLTIAILDDKGGELAWGLAHHFREDLSAASLATGWCGFRVRSTLPVGRLKQRALTLVDRSSGAEIVRRYPVPYAQDPDAVLSTIPEIVAADPTMTPSIFQLKGCEELFAEFVQQRGVDTYVAAAYAYVLGRAVDLSGLASYGNLIRENTLTPFQLLAILSDSDEFRSKPRLLAAPNSAGFPFR